MFCSEYCDCMIVRAPTFRRNFQPSLMFILKHFCLFCGEIQKVSAVVHKSNQSAWFNKNLSPLNELRCYWRKNDPQHISSFPGVPQTARDRAGSQNGTSAGENGGVGIMYSELFMYNISNGKTIKWDWWRDEDNWVGLLVGGGAGGVGGELDLPVCLSLFAYLLEAQMSALSSLWTPH